jgi:hypothetical protein
MGKLIRSLAEGKLRIMRAAVDTHSFAFPRLGENRTWRIWRGGHIMQDPRNSFSLLFLPPRKGSKEV